MERSAWASLIWNIVRREKEEKKESHVDKSACCYHRRHVVKVRQEILTEENDRIRAAFNVRNAFFLRDRRGWRP